jgi:hypothetical protein
VGAAGLLRQGVQMSDDMHLSEYALFVHCPPTEVFFSPLFFRFVSFFVFVARVCVCFAWVPSSATQDKRVLDSPPPVSSSFLCVQAIDDERQLAFIHSLLTIIGDTLCK